MKLGNSRDEADVLACRIGRAINRYNSVELSRVDPQDSRAMWAEVRQLTGRSRTHRVKASNPAITANSLNELSCRQTDLPPPIVEGFERVQHISVLGVTLTYNLTMTTHNDNIITSCAHVLYGLRTLRSHGMPPPALHAVFQSTAMAKVTYAYICLQGYIYILQPGGDSLTPRIEIALRPLSAG